jgi:hypothetical protein
MSHNFLLNTSFHNKLLEIDQKTAEQVRTQGCRHCGGELHQANYPRIGFGIHSNIAAVYATRLSFCCARCRRRTTPPSIRFFGQRRFIAATFVLLCALRLSPSDKHQEQLARRLGITLSLSTWKRWRAWWHYDFLQTRFWAEAKSHVVLIITEPPLPKALLQYFSGKHSLEPRLILLLQWLSPLSCRTA